MAQKNKISIFILYEEQRMMRILYHIHSPLCKRRAEKHLLFKTEYDIIEFINLKNNVGMMELADVADSKSADSDIVRVQVPLPAPDLHDGFDMKTIVLFLLLKKRTIFGLKFYSIYFRAYRGTLFRHSNGVLLLFRSVRIFLCAFLPYIFSGSFQDGFLREISVRS